MFRWLRGLRVIRVTQPRNHWSLSDTGAITLGREQGLQVCIHLNVKLHNGIVRIGFVNPMLCIECIVNKMHALSLYALYDSGVWLNRVTQPHWSLSDTGAITLGQEQKLWPKRLKGTISRYESSCILYYSLHRSHQGSTAYCIYLIIDPVESKITSTNKQIINLDFLNVFLLLNHWFN